MNQNNAYIESPAYPAAAATGMCSYTIKKCDSNVCQYRFYISNFQIFKYLKTFSWQT